MPNDSFSAQVEYTAEFKRNLRVLADTLTFVLMFSLYFTILNMEIPLETTFPASDIPCSRFDYAIAILRKENAQAIA